MFVEGGDGDEIREDGLDVTLVDEFSEFDVGFETPKRSEDRVSCEGGKFFDFFDGEGRIDTSVSEWNAKVFK